MGRVGLLAAAFAVAAVVAIAANRYFARGDEQSAGGRVSACVAGDNADRCLRRVYSSAVERGEVAQTLAALEDLSRRGRLADCHLEAHLLAGAVYRAVGDVERTFLLGGPHCRMGYLHGAVEASGAVGTRGAGGVFGVAIPVCARFRRAAERGACSHGFGHALMLRTRHDLRKSTRGCRAAARRGLEREPCELGVMMQNSLRFAGRSDFGRSAERGCDGVSSSQHLLRLCFDNIGVVAALTHGHDRARALAECAKVSALARRACSRGALAEIAEARSLAAAG